MVLIGTLFALVTFGVLTANVAMKTKDPALIQAIFPMTFIMIFLTTGFQPKAQIASGVMRAVIDANTAEYVLRPMRELMLSRYDRDGIGLAFLVILALALLGLPLTIRNYRSVYLDRQQRFAWSGCERSGSSVCRRTRREGTTGSRVAR